MSATQHQRLLGFFSCPNTRSNACCNTSSKTSSKHIGCWSSVCCEGTRRWLGQCALSLPVSTLGLNPLPLVYDGSYDKRVTRQVKTLHVILGQPRDVCCLLLSVPGRAGRADPHLGETSPEPECDPFYSSHHAATPHRAARHTCRPRLTMSFSYNTQRRHLSAYYSSLTLS